MRTPYRINFEQPVLSLLDHSHRDEVLVIVGQSFGHKIR